MGRILILEEILAKALEEGDGLLFGKKNLLKLGKNIYDFIFHYLPKAKAEKINPTQLMIIPMLPYCYPEESDNAKAEMYGLYGKNPALTTFATRDSKPKIVTHHESIQSLKTKSLKFFNVNKTGIGTEINSIDQYWTAGEKDFAEKVKKWDMHKAQINALKSEIDTMYGQADSSNLTGAPR